MQKSKTSFVSYPKQPSKSTKIANFKYKFCNKLLYRLKDKTRTLLAKINYDSWKRQFLEQLIDIAWNSSLIAGTWFLWTQEWLFLKGVAITLFFIIVISYVKDFQKLFEKQRGK